MDQQSISALENNNLLKNADINTLNIGQEIGRIKSVNGGEVLYREGDTSDSVYMILNGEVNLLKKGVNGTSQSVIFSDNDFFGAKELFTNIERCTTTVSLMDTYLVEFTKDEVNHLIEKDDKIALNIQKGSKDFKFDDGVIEILEDDDRPEYPHDLEYLQEMVSEDDISEILESVKKQEEDIISDLNNYIENENHFEYIKTEEISDDKRRNNFNSEIKLNNNSEESTMSTENIQLEKDYLTTEQFEMVVKSLQLLNANVKRDDVLKNIVDVAANLTNADRGTLYLVDKETDELWSKVLIGPEIEEIRLKVGEGLAGWVAQSGEILNVIDVNDDERFERSFDEVTGYTTKNMLVFPIKNKTDETVGVLQLLNSIKGGFSKQEEIFLNAISLNAALALENASLVEQLIHSERNTSIGKMGNFLTYDLRKPIMICKRYSEHLKKKELDFDVKQVVNLLDEQLDQVSSQLACASDFTEGTTLLRRQPLNVNQTLHEFANKAHNIVKANGCKIEHELGEDVSINVDKKEFYQCYYNVVKNAAEALPEGGTIVVSSKKNGDEVLLSFNDKGVGINNADLKFIFDPLWSKNKKNNSGLGLSISKKIVEDHDGVISVTSEEEFGTTVRICLPIH